MCDFPKRFTGPQTKLLEKKNILMHILCKIRLGKGKNARNSVEIERLEPHAVAKNIFFSLNQD